MYGLSDKGFGELLGMQKRMLPKDNELFATITTGLGLVAGPATPTGHPEFEYN